VDDSGPAWLSGFSTGLLVGVGLTLALLGACIYMRELW
jgi:hypothetical protein